MRHYIPPPPCRVGPPNLTGNGVLARGIKGDIQSFPVHQLKKEDQQISACPVHVSIYFQFCQHIYRKYSNPVC